MLATDLRALRDKYERMLRLRRLHERARDDADFVEPDPRPAMAELARLYPGALREIDELPIDVIHERLEQLDAAEADRSRVLAWMIALDAFHRLARGALTVKRWLHGRAWTESVGASFQAALASMPERERADAVLWTNDLAAVAKPPRGRVMDLVYAKLARELGIEVSAAREAVLPRSLRRRGRGAGRAPRA